MEIMEHTEKDFPGYEVIKVPVNIRQIDEYYYLLEGYKKNGTKKLFKYGDKILYPGITHQAIWYLCGGMQMEDYAKAKEEKEKLEKTMAHRRDYIPKEDLDRINAVKQVRSEKENGKKIIVENVISGLKFMAENRSLSQDEFNKGLIDRGCVFTINDILDEYIYPYSIEKFRDGDIGAGAYVIANARDSEASRRMLEDVHFNSDDDISVYHFIRTVTGNDSYTKKLIEQNKKSK